MKEIINTCGQKLVKKKGKVIDITRKQCPPQILALVYVFSKNMFDISFHRWFYPAYLL